MTKKQIFQGIKNRDIIVFASTAKNPEWLSLSGGVYSFSSTHFPKIEYKNFYNFHNGIYFYAFPEEEEVLKDFVNSLVDPIIINLKDKEVQNSIKEIYQSDIIPKEFKMRSPNTIFLSQVPELFEDYLFKNPLLSQKNDKVLEKPKEEWFKLKDNSFYKKIKW